MNVSVFSKIEKGYVYIVYLSSVCLKMNFRCLFPISFKALKNKQNSCVRNNVAIYLLNRLLSVNMCEMHDVTESYVY